MCSLDESSAIGGGVSKAEKYSGNAVRWIRSTTGFKGGKIQKSN